MPLQLPGWNRRCKLTAVILALSLGSFPCYGSAGKQSDGSEDDRTDRKGEDLYSHRLLSEHVNLQHASEKFRLDQPEALELRSPIFSTMAWVSQPSLPPRNPIKVVHQLITLIRWFSLIWFTQQDQWQILISGILFDSANKH